MMSPKRIVIAGRGDERAMIREMTRAWHIAACEYKSYETNIGAFESLHPARDAERAPVRGLRHDVFTREAAVSGAVERGDDFERDFIPGQV